MKKIFSRLGIFFVVSAAMSVLAAGTAFAAAPTGFTSQVFQDSDANGTVDQVVVVINGAEDLVACVVTDVEIATDWTYVANSLTGSTLTSSGNTHSCVTTTETVTLKITGAPANTTSAGTLPTIAYDNDDADNSITNLNASPNLGTVAAANAADDANPIITLAQTQDTNNNGKLDALKLTFSETMDTTAFNGYVANTNFTPLTLALAVVTGEAVISTDATQTALSETDTDNLVYIGFTENASTCSSSDQTGCDTELTSQDLTLTGASAAMDDLAVADNDLGNVIAGTIAETDLAKPVLMKVLAATATGANTIAFTFSEAVTTCTGASTATCGNLTAVGTIAGLGNFTTNGNILVATGKNTVAGSTTDTITVTLANVTGGFLESSDDVVALTVPSDTIAADATAGVLDAASNQANASGAAATATTLPSAAWDTTRPTISSGVLSDSFANNSAFVAGGTFNTGSDGRADQIIFTASEALRGSTLAPDAAGTRNDWAVTGAAGEYGTLTVIKAAPVTAGDTGTTFTLNFSGANLYYASPTTFNVVNTQDAAPGFTDRAGNPLAGDPTVTTQAYRICFTGLTCSGSTLGNVAVITSTITQPANTADVTGPAAAKDLKAEVVEAKEVKLTWTDPTDADLSNIKIYRVKNSETETSLEVLGKGVKTYTDKAVAKGDKVKYRLSGFDTSGNEGTKTDYTTEVTVEVAVVVVEEKPAAEPITVDLLKQGESGAPGLATIEEVAGKVKVTIALDLAAAAAGDSHPAHLHMGTCAATGDIKHNLTSVVDGVSVTTLELTLAELQAQYPLYLNVHESDADLATTRACGNLEAETVLPEVELEGVVEESVAVVDGTITEAVSVQNTETGAAVSIAAETMATVGGVAFTGTIAPPVVIEKEVTVPEGSKAASAVFSIDTGVTGSVVFDKPVTLVFPAKGTVSTKKVYTMYTVSADGKLSEPIVCAVKTLDGAKVFECKSSHLTEFVILESEPEVAEEEEEKVAEAPFVDTKTHWSKDFVADLYAKKIVSGKDATHYAPDAYISRAEFTKIVIVGLGISVKAAKDIKDMPFKDVKATDWALPYIDAAKTAGVIGGYKDGTFKSDAMINRAEAMKILFEAAKIETKNAAATKLSDVKQGEWYAKYVNYAVEKKIVSGYKDGTFGTDKNLTRGEVAKIVSLLLADM